MMYMCTSVCTQRAIGLAVANGLSLSLSCVPLHQQAHGETASAKLTSLQLLPAFPLEN